jgi:MFS family permease
VQNPITLFAPLYLQKVLTVDPLTVGLVMMALPISTLIAGPIGGSLADRYNPRVVAGAGVILTLAGVVVYAQLGVDSALLPVVAVLILVGLGASLFRPANQVAVYAQTDRRDYGALAAMLVLIQSFAGTLGTTIAVAANETRSAGDDPASFVEGQRFTFMALVPLLVLSVIVSFVGRTASRPKPATTQPEPEVS